MSTGSITSEMAKDPKVDTFSGIRAVVSAERIIVDGDGTHVAEQPKGTVLLTEGHDGDIILSPTPSNDPADPLNWSTFKKINILCALVWWSTSGLACQGFLASFLPSLLNTFPDMSDSQENLLFTIVSPLVGAGDIIFVALSLTYGRRFTLLLSIVVLLVANVVGATAKNYNQLVVARILEGIGSSTTDAIGFTIVQDFSFAHQRATFFAVLACGQVVGQALYAIATNYLGVNVGFAWAFCLFALTNATSIVWIYFAMPETRYIIFRHAGLIILLTFPQIYARRYYRKLEHGETAVTLSNFEAHRASIQTKGDYLAFTLRRRLQIWVGAGQGDDASILSIFKLVARVFWHPTIWWQILMSTSVFGAFTAIFVYFAELLVSPPWSWPAENVGLVNLAIIPVGIFNYFAIGVLNDKIVIWRARRNHGISEPEHRLFALAIPITFAALASIGFGLLAQNYLVTDPGGPQAHWFSFIVIFFLIESGFAGMLQVQTAYLAAAADPTYSLACMTAVFMSRDMLSFGMSYGVTPFAAKCGFAVSFGIYGMLIAVFGLMAIPFYFYGKRLRAWSGGVI